MATAVQTSSRTKQAYPWWIYLIEGVMAIALGALLLVMDVDVNRIKELVQFMGFFLLVTGLLAIVSIFTHSGHWGLKLIVGLCGLAAGYLILGHPSTSGLSETRFWIFLVGVLAIVMGFIAFIQAFIGAGWPSAILGVATMLLGVLLSTQAYWELDFGVMALPYVLGIIFLIGGVAAILGSLSLFMKRGDQVGHVQGELEEQGTYLLEPQTGDKVEQVDEASIILLEETTYSSTEGEEGDTRPTVVADEVSWAYEGEGSEEEGASAEEGGEEAEDLSGAELAGAAVVAAIVADEESEEGEADLADEDEGEEVTRAALIEVVEEGEEEAGEGEEQPEAVDEDQPEGESQDMSGVIVGEVVLIQDEDEQTGDETEEAGIAEVDQPGDEGDQVPELEEEPLIVEDANLQPGVESTVLDVGDAEKRLLDHKVQEMEGIGPVYSEKLGEVGIVTAMDLLTQGAVRKGRVEIAEKTGISQKLVLKWVNQADLYRISGIGSEYAELLEASGVDTVVELATRKPENLHQAMVTTNEEKKLVRQVPSLSQVEGWVQQAKELPRIIRY